MVYMSWDWASILPLQIKDLKRKLVSGNEARRKAEVALADVRAEQVRTLTPLARLLFFTFLSHLSSFCCLKLGLFPLDFVSYLKVKVFCSSWHYVCSRYPPVFWIGHDFSYVDDWRLMVKLCSFNQVWFVPHWISIYWFCLLGFPFVLHFCPPVLYLSSFQPSILWFH